MRYLSRLLLVAAMAVATITFGVSGASAQTLELTDENTGNHCAAVATSGTNVTGGCLIHANSEGTVELRKHVFGIESHITNCNNEFHGRADEDASNASRIFEQHLTGANCARQACAETFEKGGTPWVASGFEGTPQGLVEGTEYLTTNFCVEPVGGGADEMCEIDVPFQTAENQHRAEFGHNVAVEMPGHGISGFRCELKGHWNTELGGTEDGTAEQEVVVAHCDGGGCSGGGGGGHAMNLEPDSITFTKVGEKRGMRLKNTGSIPWHVKSWSLGGSYSIHDPSDCLESGSASTLGPNQICDFEITATATNSSQTALVVKTTSASGTLQDSSSLKGP